MFWRRRNQPDETVDEAPAEPAPAEAPPEPEVGPTPGPRERHAAGAAGDGHRQHGFGRGGPHFRRWRAMINRWIWFVPSKICVTLASRIIRSTGCSLT